MLPIGVNPADASRIYYLTTSYARELRFPRCCPAFDSGSKLSRAHRSGYGITLSLGRIVSRVALYNIDDPTTERKQFKPTITAWAGKLNIDFLQR
jgi:hypothetical protein